MGTAVFSAEQVRTRLDDAAREGSPVLIRYVNRRGEISERRIEPQITYERYGRYYVRAYCRLRGELRTFALRRMELIDEETGKTAITETVPQEVRSAGGAASAAQPAAAAGTPSGGREAGGALSRTGPAASRPPQQTWPPAGRLSRHPAPSPQQTGPAVVPPPQQTRPPNPASPPQQTGRHPASPPRGERDHRKQQNSGAGGQGFWAVLFGLVLLVALFQTGLFHPPSPSDAEEQPQQSERAESGESGRESGPPRRWEYRGYEVRRTASGTYTVPALEVSAQSGRRAHYIINAVLFIRETGMESEQLLQRYAAADRDGNGHLSWSEVAEFQQATARRFRYQHNALALRPDRFLSRGGGDCEDFALYTCGMLQYWGWNCKVATLVPPDGGQGHAVAFVWSARPISGYGSLRIREGTLAGGMRIKPGYWIPIDYEAVGSFTAAVGGDWRLSGVMEPVPLYGRLM